MLSYLLSSEVSKCSVLKTFSTFCLQSNKPFSEISIPALGVRLGLPNSPPLGKQRAESALNVPPTQMSGLKKKSKRKTCLYPRETANTGGWAVGDMGHTNVYTKVRAPPQESQTGIKASDRSTERSAALARKRAKRQLGSSVSLSLKSLC